MKRLQATIKVMKQRVVLFEGELTTPKRETQLSKEDEELAMAQLFDLERAMNESLEYRVHIHLKVSEVRV